MPKPNSTATRGVIRQSLLSDRACQAAAMVSTSMWISTSSPSLTSRKEESETAPKNRGGVAFHGRQKLGFVFGETATTKDRGIRPTGDPKRLLRRYHRCQRWHPSDRRCTSQPGPRQRRLHCSRAPSARSVSDGRCERSIGAEVLLVRQLRNLSTDAVCVSALRHHVGKFGRPSS